MHSAGFDDGTCKTGFKGRETRHLFIRQRTQHERKSSFWYDASSLPKYFSSSPRKENNFKGGCQENSVCLDLTHEQVQCHDLRAGLLKLRNRFDRSKY